MSDKTEINDYEINMLFDRRNYYRRGTKSTNTGLAYYYTRSIIRYMTRLIFAIGWNKLRNSATVDINRKVYSTLFKDPKEKNGKDSIEPGTFAHLLKTSARDLDKASVVKKEIDLLYELGEVRNYDAHVINTVDFSQFYNDSDIAFSDFADFFKGKLCSYIIPCEYVDRNEILCKKLERGDLYPVEIRLPSDLFEWAKTGNRLFYAVTDENTGETEYYCLSPFIEIPSFIEDEHPHFRIYDRVKDNGYGNECDLLYYDAVVPRNIKEINGEYGIELSADFEKSSSDYSRSALFTSPDIKDKSAWIPSFNNDVFINISSYPGFGDVLKNKYKYCSEICPIREKVIDFCKDNKKQAVQITGNGGVGKTALMLSILSELFMSKKAYSYSNLIFVSAKKNYYLYETMSYRLQDFEKEADIHCYKDLIIKLANLLEISYSDNDINSIAEMIIRQINNGVSYSYSAKKFLLVIDDMDSLDGNDQKLIMEFVYKLDARAFKTIVTTRNIADNSPISYQLNELTNEASLLFAAWYAENNLSISPWSGWSRKQDAADWINKYGEGNPLTIQMLLVLVKSGLEKTYDAPATKQERVAYLYSTVQNLLNGEEKQVFEICRQLYLAIPDDRMGQDMLLTVPEYLSAGCGISRELFQEAMEKLVRLKLIILSPNELQFKPYSTFILSDSVVDVEMDTVPVMFKLVWKDVRKTPDDWLSIKNIEGKIASYVMSIENEKRFDNITGRRILERILMAPYISGTIKNEIGNWLARHTINSVNDDNYDETANRLIQSIEKKLELLKRTIESGNEDPSLEQNLNDEIRKLKKIIDSVSDSRISQRLSYVMSEIRRLDNL